MKIQISEERLAGMIREAVVSVLKEVASQQGNNPGLLRRARRWAGNKIVDLGNTIAGNQQEKAPANQQKQITYTNGWPGDASDFARKQSILKWSSVAERETGERWNRSLETPQQFFERVWDKMSDVVKDHFPPEFIPRNHQVQPQRPSNNIPQRRRAQRQPSTNGTNNGQEELRKVYNDLNSTNRNYPNPEADL